MSITPEQREQHLRWLREITTIPTAAGREFRVVRWIERWCAERPALALTKNATGNLHVQARGESGARVNAGEREAAGDGRPVYFTAHLDHPAFVVEQVVGAGVVHLSFRGGVMEDYFANARVRIWNDADESVAGTLGGEAKGAEGPFKRYVCELDASGVGVGVGDVGVWDLPAAEVIRGEMHTLACDDLAALAAALAAMDVLLAKATAGELAWEALPRLLFTRAEEIGFIGAIAAVRHGTMPKDARVIALENSRAFPESPIGGGPIVRVGDRLSVFSPSLTAAVAARAEEHAGGAASVTASQKLSDGTAWKWQRKLMAGGACEASVFYQAGYEATCVCLPLGNYHNMGDLAAVQAGANTRAATIEREFIGVGDFEGLVDLLVACGERLPEAGGLASRFEKLWKERAFVLEG